MMPMSRVFTLKAGKGPEDLKQALLAQTMSTTFYKANVHLAKAQPGPKSSVATRSSGHWVGNVLIALSVLTSRAVT